MQVKVAFFIVVAYFITLASQEKRYTKHNFHDKKCDDKFAHIRIKILEFFINIRRFLGLRKPVKLNVCDTDVPSTTEATTTTTTTTTTIATTTTTTTTTTICRTEPPLGK